MEVEDDGVVLSNVKLVCKCKGSLVEYNSWARTSRSGVFLRWSVADEVFGKIVFLCSFSITVATGEFVVTFTTD